MPAENTTDPVLDANAAAGLLQEIFVLDATMAQIECAGCGSTATVRALRLYAAPLGAVLRCSRCDGILMRAVHTAHAHWLDMTRGPSLTFCAAPHVTPPDTPISAPAD